MNKKFIHLVLMLFLTCLSMTSAYSHSGGTDSYGCHTNSQTGDYHCHNPKANTSNEAKFDRSPSSIGIEVEVPKQYCCKVCNKGKACGDSCISRKKTCHQGSGCACDS